MGVISTGQPKQLSLYWLAIPAMLLATIVMIAMFFDYSAHQQTLSNAIIFDLVLTVPLVYWLIIRRSSIPTTTTVPIFIIGMLIAGSVVAPANQALLAHVKTWVLPAVEIAVVVFVLHKVRLFKRRYRADQDQNGDTFSLLFRAASEIVPDRVAYLLATELAVFYYLLMSWRKPILRGNDFTTHRKSGTVAILSVLILMIAVEATAVHILLALWSPLVAWVFTGLSVYTAFQVAGMAKSLTRRYISVEKEEIALRSGILSQASIPKAYIKSFGPQRAHVEGDTEVINLSPLSALEKPNFVIHTTHHLEMKGLYGKKQTFSSIAFFVDDPAGLNDALSTLTEQ